jgi:hypothetical protein
MVCSITLGPANPIKAPGSASITSPNMAKLAVTPPVVGSVKTEIYIKVLLRNVFLAPDWF